MRWTPLPALVFAAALASAAALAGSAAGAAERPPRPARELSTTELAKEYHRLRAKPVAPGVFDRETQAWNGRMHEVMEALVERLSGPGTRRERIVAVMGEPDADLAAAEPWWRPEERDLAGADRLLVYHWRGWHDFAWFGLARGRVVSKGWWFAGE